MAEVAFIGLGSNMQAPKQQIESALTELAAIQQTTLLTQSSFYRSKPVGPQDQDDFINAVAKLETDLDAEVLLDALQALENKHGRKRDRHWGPRTLDLDILCYGDKQIQTDRLTVPHPEIPNRTFVLLPWFEIEPDWELPELGKVKELLAKNSSELPERIT